MTINLINNIAFLIALAAAGQIVVSRFPESTLNRQVLFGLLFGGVTVLGMANPVNFVSGVFFDGRSIVLAVAGVVGGGVTAAIAAGMGAFYRYQQGGIGAPVGIMIVLLSALLGVLARQWWLCRTQPPRLIDYLALGVVVQLMQLAAFTQVPNRAGYAFIEQAWWVLLLFYPLATMLLCMMFSSYEQQLINKAALQSARDALVANERARLQRFRAYFDHSIIGFGITSAEKGWLEVNDALCAALGYTRDELTRMTWVELTYPADLSADLEQFDRMLAGEINRYYMDKRFIHKAGHLVETRLATSLVRKPDGSVDYVIAMVEDLSERKQAQAALQEKERLLLESQRIAHIGGWSWAFTGPIQWTDETYRIYGVSPETFIPTFEALVNLVHPEDGPIMREWTRACGAGEKPAEFEFRCVWPDGTVRFLSGRGERINDAENRPTYIFGTVQDITERKLTEAALRASETEFRTLTEAMPQIVWITRPDGWNIYFNQQWVDYTGLTLEESYGHGWNKPFHPDDQQRAWDAWQNAMQNEAAYSVECRLRRADGAYRWWLVRGVSLRDASGKILKWFGTCTDIEEIKETAQALRHTQALLANAEKIGRVGGWEIDVQTRQTTWTEAVYDIHELDGTDRLTVDEGINYYTPASRPIIEQAVQRAIAQGEPFDLELEIITAKGNRRSVHTMGKADLARGKVSGFFQDITERKQAQIASQAAHSRLQATLDALPDLLFEVDAECRIVNHHSQRSDLLAAPPEVFIGRQMFEFLPPEAAAICHCAIDEAAKNGFSNGMTYRLALPQGECWFELSVAPLQVGVKLEQHFIIICRDITERRKTEEDLRESEYRWRFAVEGSGDGLWDWDIQNDLVFYSERWKAILGLQNDDIGNSPMVWASHLHPGDKDRVFAEVQFHLDGQTPHYASEHRVLCKDGSLKWLLGRGLVIQRDANGKPLRMIGTNTDITERKRAEESLQQAATVFSHTREGITITGRDGTILDVNEAFTRITGYSREDAIGQNPRMLQSGRQDQSFYAAMWDALTELGHWSGEIWNRRKDGEVYAEMLTISSVKDAAGTVQHYVALFSDITTVKEHQSQLEHMAHFDALTNLPNRLLLADRLQQAMAQAQRRGQQLAVVYLDLDGFKAINDLHGHELGDRVLIVLASHMKDCLRESDTLARLGGDEFVAVLIDLPEPEASMPLLNRLLVAAALPVPIGELSLQVSASLGVTFYPQAQDIDADQLLRQADQAMYQAKLAGKNRYHVFDAVQDSSIRVQHESLERIRLALAQGEFVLHYQPKVNMHSGTVIGAEALIRWQHPQKGLMAPMTFLPVIEDHPLAVDVGEWVIDAAMHQMKTWHAAGLDLPVSVNIGARQLQQADFVARLLAILARHPQVRPDCIELEILETSALADMAQVSQVIEDCAKLGVKFALDDFGTGYSSLTYLKQLRVALLKIDQSFVRNMLDDPDDLAILQGVISLAAAFKREVIAEGVETVAHGSALLQLGCKLAQGYGIARPMPPDQLPAWAATWRPDAAWGGVMSPGEASRSTGK